MGRMKDSTIDPTDEQIMAMLEEMLWERDMWDRADYLEDLEKADS